MAHVQLFLDPIEVQSGLWKALHAEQRDGGLSEAAAETEGAKALSTAPNVCCLPLLTATLLSRRR